MRLDRRSRFPRFSEAYRKRWIDAGLWHDRTLHDLFDERCALQGDDVSLITFNDHPIAEHTAPPLTTIAVDPKGIGQQMARTLLERKENPEAPVVIQPHPESRTETMIHIFDSARQAGVYNVSLASN